ncbi:MlaA family lipoprotein [Luteimonas mephitis]|uniref:MlaA family lipoprotein n=1 Tax=Luteimonas mephitis TaxID=83615 RepID=UPI000418EC4D|nr:VacJ family lipoprotein [Luteimonas mephitis]
MTRLAAYRITFCIPLVLALAACAGHGVRNDAPPPVAAVAAAAPAIQPQAADAVDAATPAPSADAGAANAVARDDGVPEPGAAAAADGAVDATVPTQAELDYAALYGEPPYNPVYDATLPAPAQLPSSYDPWEGLNRRVHTFNNAVDRAIAKPLAKAYVKVVPRPVRLGVSNFFHNLGQPVSALNALLQGKPKQAAQALGRFALNSTLGIGGIFDPASDAKLPNKSEDFGQTLGVWGWKTSRYVELPLFGPRTVRDAFGLVGDGQLSPIRQVEDDKTRVFLQGLQLVDVRTQLFAVDSMRAGAVDDYTLVRDAWLQRRNYQIFGDREQKAEDDALPDYLREDNGNPMVPVDAMPIIPGAPTN